MAKSSALAYDYSVYENQASRASERKIRVKKNKADYNLSLGKSVATGAAVLFMLCGILYGKLELSGLYVESANLTTQLNSINMENDILETKISEITAVSSVEDYAENVLGLKKLDKSQITFVEIQEQNKIKVIKKDNNNVFVKISNCFKDLMEYIGL